MVSLGIVGIIAMVVASLASQQFKNTKLLNQKADTLELKNQVIRALGNSLACDWQFKDKVIDASTMTSTVKSPTILSLNELHMGIDAASPLLAKSGQLLPRNRNGIIVDKIFLKELYATGIPNQLMGDIEIQFNQSSLAGPIQPVVVQKVFKIEPTDPLNAKRIVNCVSSSGGSGGSFAGTFCYATPASRWGKPSCDNGYYLKALVKSTDNNWDGYGSICCFPEGSDTRGIVPANIVPGSFGLSYEDLVTMCESTPATFGTNQITCPDHDSIR